MGSSAYTWRPVKSSGGAVCTRGIGFGFWGDRLRFCLIVEERYREARMPIAVGTELGRLGHEVDMLEPGTTITCLSELRRRGAPPYDAYVLKTVAGGPGFSILAAAGAIGIPTINHWHAIRLVRDKAVAAAVARSSGISFPTTYFVAHPSLLQGIPPSAYPIVVKPCNGSAEKDVYRVESADDLARLNLERSGHLCFLAQPYIDNAGYDIKLYCTGDAVYAIQRPSPLHPGLQVEAGLVPVSPGLRRLALKIGKLFGLDIYGVDVLPTARGWVTVDVNDFPSFGLIPDAVGSIARSIVRIAHRAKADGHSSPAPRAASNGHHKVVRGAGGAGLMDTGALLERSGA